MSEFGKVCEHGSLKRQCHTCELLNENARLTKIIASEQHYDTWDRNGMILQIESYKAENIRLRAVLKKIVSFGRPLEAPKASYAVSEINTIACEALKIGEK